MKTTILRQIQSVIVKRTGKLIRVTSVEDVIVCMKKILGDRVSEHFVTIYFDGRHQVIGWEMTSIGTQTSSLVHPMRVFGTALRLEAVAIILVHNHPSGDPKPSSEDKTVTYRIAELAQLHGVALLDHVIISGTKHLSMKEAGIMPVLLPKTGAWEVTSR